MSVYCILDKSTSELSITTSIYGLAQVGQYFVEVNVKTLCYEHVKKGKSSGPVSCLLCSFHKRQIFYTSTIRYKMFFSNP